jgi:hypothetical protein
MKNEGVCKMQINMLQMKWIAILLMFLFFVPPTRVMAWNEHPLVTNPVVETIPEVRNAQPIAVESLEAFISAEEKKLEALLIDEEAWAKKKLSWYAPLPAYLVFKATGNRNDSVSRFSQAIRVNPTACFPLYLQIIPGEKMKGKALVQPKELTFLRDTSDWSETTFFRLRQGDMVRPLNVVTSASDDPDLLGIDIGLFKDNGTAFGKKYGFGLQPFGNPRLEYGNQAPFHMGFYHEAGIMYYLAGFLKKTYPEYRIHLYKKLAQLAFQTGHPYWGWRFTGWGLHYLADLTQPYHACALPGVSTAYAIWINTMDIVGIHSPKANAIQLVSNRHTALEKFVQIILQRAYKEKEKNNLILLALQTAKEISPYVDTIPRNVISKMAHDKAVELDAALKEYMPEKFVSDPEFELGTSAERQQIVEKIKMEKGQAAVDKLTISVRDLLIPFATYGRGYVYTIMNKDAN